MIAGAELGCYINPPYGSFASQYYIDTVAPIEHPKFVYLANFYPRIRVIDVTYNPADTYPNLYTQANHLWMLDLKNANPNVYILSGMACNQIFKPRYYEIVKAYILADAQWAQDNEMDTFSVGNENLISSVHGTTHGMLAASIVRSSNVATATFAFEHGLTTGDYIFVYGASPASFNVADSESAETVQCTVTGPTTITYPSAGVDESATGTIYVDWSGKEVVRKTKAIGVLAQAIFTRGPVQYSESQGHSDPWIADGITPDVDFDLMGMNIYGAGNNEYSFNVWKAEVDKCFAAFGDKLIITEHNVVKEFPDYSLIKNLRFDNAGFDEAASNEIIRRYMYLKNLGITQIYLFGPWSNGINSGLQFVFFASINPNGWTDGTKRQIIGNLMPVNYKLKGIRRPVEFFGVVTNII